MRFVFLAAAAVTAVACSDVATVTAPLQAPGSPSAAVLVNETTPVAYPILNPCNGEVVEMTGTQHFMFSSNESNGTTSFAIRQHLSGEGASGLRYQSRLSFTSTGKFDPVSSTHFYFSTSAAVVATGKSALVSSEDWHETQTFRVIVPAGGGTPSVERVSSSGECRGKSPIL